MILTKSLWVSSRNSTGKSGDVYKRQDRPTTTAPTPPAEPKGTKRRSVRRTHAIQRNRIQRPTIAVGGGGRSRAPDQDRPSGDAGASELLSWLEFTGATVDFAGDGGASTMSSLFDIQRGQHLTQLSVLLNVGFGRHPSGDIALNQQGQGIQPVSVEILIVG